MHAWFINLKLRVRHKVIVNVPISFSVSFLVGNFTIEMMQSIINAC
jgi:hypothetical protein